MPKILLAFSILCLLGTPAWAEGPPDREVAALPATGDPGSRNDGHIKDARSTATVFDGAAGSELPAISFGDSGTDPGAPDPFGPIGANGQGSGPDAITNLGTKVTLRSSPLAFPAAEASGLGVLGGIPIMSAWGLLIFTAVTGFAVALRWLRARQAPGGSSRRSGAGISRRGGRSRRPPARRRR